MERRTGKKVPDTFNSPLDRQTVPGRLLGQQIQIHPPVVVDEEHILPVVAPLHDMVGATGHNCSSCPWHNARLHPSYAPVKLQIGGCPYL